MIMMEMAVEVTGGGDNGEGNDAGELATDLLLSFSHYVLLASLFLFFVLLFVATTSNCAPTPINSCFSPRGLPLSPDIFFFLFLSVV
jgi:hypothetical protein